VDGLESLEKAGLLPAPLFLPHGRRGMIEAYSIIFLLLNHSFDGCLYMYFHVIRLPVYMYFEPFVPDSIYGIAPAKDKAQVLIQICSGYKGRYSCVQC
jgi:hypothetical protein